MRRAIFLLVAVAGCEKTDPLYCKMKPMAAECGGMSGMDAMDAEDMSLIDGRLCFGAGSGSVCLTTPPSGPANFPNPTTLDTTASPSCLTTQPADWKAAGQPDACFVVGTSIKIDGKLTVTGNRPLVMLASTTLVINADIDAAGHGDVPGPAGPAACGAFTQSPTGTTAGGGGGAGGSFVTKGGDGGAGDNGNANSAPGKAAAADSADPALLRAGCNGQVGGPGDGSVGQGAGGVAGGAAYLVAGTSITIASGVKVNVSGGGGGQPGRQGGGGGGGSGGMLVLYTPTITATGALVFANGGGGGSGGDDVVGGGSNPGGDPSTPTAMPLGGTASGAAGFGGNGYYNDGTEHTAASGTQGNSNRGGGAGGGGAGWIQSNVDLTGAIISPPPHVVP